MTKDSETRASQTASASSSRPYLMELRLQVASKAIAQTKLDIVSWKPSEEVRVPIFRTPVEGNVTQDQG